MIEMSEDTFKVYKAHKMADWLESECTEWASDLVKEHFEVEEVEHLTEDQLQEVIAQFEELDGIWGDSISVGFLNVIRTWENENETYIY